MAESERAYAWPCSVVRVPSSIMFSAYSMRGLASMTTTLVNRAQAEFNHHAEACVVPALAYAIIEQR